MNRYAASVRKGKMFSVSDLVVIVCMVLLCCIPVLVGFFTRISGDVVKIDYNGKTSVYRLSEDREISLKDEKIVVVIRDGCVWVKKSDCEDKVCVHAQKIRYSGQSIICLPNNLVITIEGDGFDGSTGGGV